ncbi:MAG: NAD(P)H-dependent oxidoreductase [Atribacterota bacterium]
MKILGIVGSNRKKGNSYLLLKEMFRNLPEIEVRIIQVAELKIKPKGVEQGTVLLTIKI